MSAYVTVVFGVFGLVIGSFLNVCIYRLPKKISVAKGRSYCPHCNNTLSPIDLVPVLSFVFLKGKCRRCKERISPRYAAVELLTSALFAANGYVFGIMRIEQAVLYSLFFAILVVIAFIDIDTMEIPDRLHLFIAIIAVANPSLYSTNFWQYLLGAVIISIPMYLIALITGGFGGADIKLMAAAGLLLGAKIIVVSFLIAILIMGSIGIVLIIRKALFRRNYVSKVPFCPGLAVGCIIGTYYGELIANRYLSYIL